MFRIGLKLAFIFCFIPLIKAQDKYWVDEKFKEKLCAYNVRPIVCSEWLNTCSYNLPDTLISILINENIPLDRVGCFDLARESRRIPGFALEQVKGVAFSSLGISGKGVKIGIIDGGYLNANTYPSVANLFKGNQIKEYRDYITPDLPPYEGIALLDDVHGTEVLQLIGGYDEEKKVQFGLATGSDYYLARTDHGGFEKRQEEDLLIQALEDMYEKGIRLINISLGYAKGYNNAAENYTPEQMNGQTSMMSRAIDTAFYRKNMLVVVAAGNEGNDSKWRVLSTPGDAEGALTVGATKLKVWEKLDYSSIGTEQLNYLKPNVSCFSTQGTSFSTPIITGIAACMMEMDSTLTASDIKGIIEKSANFYPFGNNYVGYGVPDCEKIISIMKGEKPKSPKIIETRGNSVKIQSNTDTYIVAYHKSGRNVINREVYRPKKEQIKLKKFEEAEQTSVIINQNVIEIIWE